MSIKANDLVYVAHKSHCGSDRGIGCIHRVESVSQFLSMCSICQEIRQVELAYMGRMLWIDTARLKKLDDPSLPEGIVREKDLVCR
jgi:hypothetical protein